ncbi:lysosomal Pro-X carboxypeptidase isoform X5 [Nycticebus coucang]|uniref:lysosomal Pro-X carboxypeptidase isoform X5 n=1 Tax=Nycticebus coucang TaxID=9470 RepID=UPI00234CD5B2|nr:lysosomal Pro-X carboxypeptidase isoform X5 [Nycticebus coucang]
MGCLALQLLLLAFLASGSVKALQPALIALGSLHLPTNPTSHPAVAKDYSVLYFQQKIDHFGFNSVKTFNQRYLIANEYWKKDGGSILFYTGNEGDIIWFCNNTGFMWDVAQELKAMLVFAEHRYYGESLPFGKNSFKDSRHLNYLTSEQALADFAELIKHLQETVPGVKNQPVIAIGGSYGGMLAAWFRMKYPHIVVGALAASAPIWQFEDLVPCGVFMKIVTSDFKRSGPYCSETIRKSWNVINQLSSTSKGLEYLTEVLHLCSPLTPRDVQHLKDWIAETWVNLAMVDYPYPSSFLQPLPAWPIKDSEDTGVSVSEDGKLFSLFPYYHMWTWLSSFFLPASSQETESHLMALGRVPWHHTAHSNLQLLGSSDSPASASRVGGTTGTHHSAQPSFGCSSAGAGLEPATLGTWGRRLTD